MCAVLPFQNVTTFSELWNKDTLACRLQGKTTC
jgi:hypothetical protein